MVRFIRLHVDGREQFINIEQILCVSASGGDGKTLVSFNGGYYVRPDEPVEDVMDLIAFANAHLD